MEAARQGIHRCYGLNPAFDWKGVKIDHVVAWAHERKRRIAAWRAEAEERNSPAYKRAELAKVIEDLERRQQAILTRKGRLVLDFYEPWFTMNRKRQILPTFR